ncbi:flagellin [Thermococcus celer]|uniref:Flagellin n=1 Tax=Thermococcus celer Vu 13 = JCM 8558 TaxID=1293037 RepID=A0A218P420_THECE|nr:flagellin [Thermococcus celer]ASI99666.1 flagellin [Thermococcus celer] [Thermococcus celer Vu 13 = JCM 8558]
MKVRTRRGAVGIGTLIVFIAMVLVAAVAAAVLINTSGFLQQKASSTGRETTQQVASGIQVERVVGKANGLPTTQYIQQLAIYVTPNAGSSGIDLSNTKIILKNESTEAILKYDPTHAAFTSTVVSDIFNVSLAAWASLAGNTTREFGIIVLQDADGSLTSEHPTLNKGDLAVLTLLVGDLGSDNGVFGAGIGPGEKISGEVVPEFGAPGVIEFVTPSTYTESVMDLQ